MGWLSNLFATAPAPVRKVPITISYTEEEEAAFAIHQREMNSFAPEPGQVLYLHPELARCMQALALVKHVRRELGIADNAPQHEFPLILEKLIKTQAKAAVMHELRSTSTFGLL